MRVLLVILVVLWETNAGRAATNEALPFRTNFVAGYSLSATELQAVIKLANLCGIGAVAEVSTERHLGGTTIRVSGDEQIKGRSVLFKTLFIYPNDHARVRPVDAPSVGAFWAAESKPANEERTLVRVGDREVRVGLLGGIKPAGVDRIFDAFANGRVRFQDETVHLSKEDLMQPSWIGISEGKLVSFVFISSAYKYHLVSVQCECKLGKGTSIKGDI